MSDGCWVQFWDDNDCSGPTIRIDADGPVLLVNDMDDYTQSDGSSEENEPNSLKTGSRTWLTVYKDEDFGGTSASFGPNTEIGDLDLYDVGGNISSFKMYDSRQPGFNSSATGSPTTIESSDSFVSAETVSNVFCSIVSGAIGEIPVVGGVLGTLISGIWPSGDSDEEQMWACFQNYLNQSIAGVYWQLTYESLEDTLHSLYGAAIDYAHAGSSDKEYKISMFTNLYTQVNNLEPYFIDKDVPEKRYMFLAPFATLRLATLLENLTHFDYYYSAPPSEETKNNLEQDINDSIDLYQSLLDKAASRIRDRRGEQIMQDEDNSYHGADWDTVVDRYNGGRLGVYVGANPSLARNFYADQVDYQLALKLSIHNAIGQLWELFRPGAEIPSPVPEPVITYQTGPYGAYNDPQEYFHTDEGSITKATIWGGSFVDALQLSVNGTEGARCGGSGGSPHALELHTGEVINKVSGYQAGLINDGSELPYPYYAVPFYPFYEEDFIHQLGFTANQGNSVSVGTTDRTYFEAGPLPGTSETQLVGLLGYKSHMDSYADIDDLVSCLICQWKCNLKFVD